MWMRIMDEIVRFKPWRIERTNVPCLPDPPTTMRTNTCSPAVQLFALLTLLMTFVHQGHAADKSAGIAPVYTAQETAAFKSLAKETIAALDAGKKEVMVEKLTDLETAWDEKEESLKKRNEATWVIIDKTLDKAISALRSSKKNLPKGKASLEDLIKMLDQATKG